MATPAQINQSVRFYFTDRWTKERKERRATVVAVHTPDVVDIRVAFDANDQHENFRGVQPGGPFDPRRHQDGYLRNTDGTIASQADPLRHPDGSLRRPGDPFRPGDSIRPGDPSRNADGSWRAADGSILTGDPRLHPDGSTRNQDGSIRTPDGTTRMSDARRPGDPASANDPAFRVSESLQPGDPLMVAGGTVRAGDPTRDGGPFDSTRNADGSVRVPDGSLRDGDAVRNADGSIGDSDPLALSRNPDGSPRRTGDPIGTTRNPDGSLRNADGTLRNPGDPLPAGDHVRGADGSLRRPGAPVIDSVGRDRLTSADAGRPIRPRDPSNPQTWGVPTETERGIVYSVQRAPAPPAEMTGAMDMWNA